ncbi:hypothetical protein Tco_0622983 [Tanacetum coccineum]
MTAPHVATVDPWFPSDDTTAVHFAPHPTCKGGILMNMWHSQCSTSVSRRLRGNGSFAVRIQLAIEVARDEALGSTGELIVRRELIGFNYGSHERMVRKDLCANVCYYGIWEGCDG